MTPAQIRIALSGVSSPSALGRPVISRGDETWIDVALFIGGASDLESLDGLEDLTFELYVREGADSALAALTLTQADLNDSLTLAQWSAGTAQHGRFPLTSVHTNIALGTRQGVLWAVIYGTITGGTRRTFGAGEIIFRDVSAGADGPPGELDPLYPTLAQISAFTEKVNGLTGDPVATEAALEQEAAARATADSVLTDALGSRVTQDALSAELAVLGNADAAMGADISTLLNSDGAKTAQIAALQGAVTGLEVGDAFTVATAALLPAAANATGKTRYASVYADPAPASNGRYYQESGASAWHSVAGDPTQRIAAVEVQSAGSASKLVSTITLTTSGADQFLFPLVMAGGYNNGMASVALGVTPAGRTFFKPTTTAADYVFDYATPAKITEQGAKLLPRVENGWVEFPAGGKVMMLDVAGAPAVIEADKNGHWRPLQGASSGAATSLSPRTVITEVIGKFAAVYGYGQSNVIGADGLPLLSTTQVYGNISFGVGPRAGSGDLTALAPLVETAIDPAPDGDSGRGESFCSGLANGVSIQFSASLSPSSFPFKMFVSTAGKGGSEISVLDGSPTGTSGWYPLLTSHMAAAKSLINATGDSVTCLAIVYDQGETDAADSRHTPRATYRARLAALVDKMCADARAAHGQDFDPLVMIVTVGYNSTVWPDIALAQWDLRDHPNVMLVMPDYFLPTPNGLHRTAAGHRLMGYYLSYAFRLWFVDKLHFRALQPVRVFGQARTIRIIFAAPKLPIVLDDSLLPGLADHGFQVTDSVGILTIASIAVVAPDTLQITVTRNLTGGWKVTGGIAKTRSTPGFTTGSCGLRDSTAAVIDGNILRQYCLPFEMIG